MPVVLLWVAYPKGGVTGGATDLPATPWWTKRDVLGEITGEIGFKPVAFVKIDDDWTALRFKRTSRHRSSRSEEHTSELQSHLNLVCRLLLEKKKQETGDECTCSDALVLVDLAADAHSA